MIALIAHDLLKFMEEENHYRKARENLKSDVEKIRQSRKNSAVRTEISATSSKPRARSSVSAFRNTYSRASNVNSRASNVNYNNQNANANATVVTSSSSRPVAYKLHEKVFPPTKTSTANTNYLIDKLIIQVYGQK